MLTQKPQPQEAQNWASANYFRSENKTPLVLNTNFITTEAERRARNATDYVQPRWEDGGQSTFTERGSVGSASNDVNLVFTGTEVSQGMVFKRFREFQRVDGDAETKSISNRSVASESSRVNSVSFRPYRPAEEMEDRSQNSVAKAGPRPLEDTKSERLFVLDTAVSPSARDKAGFYQNKNHGLKPADDLQAQPLTNGGSAKNSRKNLSEARFEVPKENPAPFTAEKALSDPKRAAEMIRGEIAEADLVLDNGGRFEGELVDGKMNGYGRLFDVHGLLLFEGDFVDNEYEGVGILYNHEANKDRIDLESNSEGGFDWALAESSWVKYEGLFKRGRFHGRGYLHLGKRYVVVAEFENGSARGEAVLRDIDTRKTRRLRELKKQSMAN